MGLRNKLGECSDLPNWWIERGFLEDRGLRNKLGECSDLPNWWIERGFLEDRGRHNGLGGCSDLPNWWIERGFLEDRGRHNGLGRLRWRHILRRHDGWRGKWQWRAPQILFLKCIVKMAIRGGRAETSQTKPSSPKEVHTVEENTDTQWMDFCCDSFTLKSGIHLHRGDSVVSP
jgi:hypothetical protein